MLNTGMKISVIIPVFNAEKYLNQCIESVLNQTYKNIELLIVDDGSTDTSLSICETYKNNDARIRVIKNSRGGVSKARNTALDIATGDYVGFVDSDDFIEPEMFEKLITLCEMQKADMAICNFTSDENFLEKTDIISSTPTLYESHKLVEQYWFTKKIDIHELTLWHMLFRRNVIHQLRFNEKLINGEDNLFVLNAMLNSNSIVLTDEQLYHYVKREGGLSSALDWNKKLSRAEAMHLLLEVLRKHYPQYKHECAYESIKTDVLLSKYMADNGCSGCKRRVEQRVRIYMRDAFAEHKLNSFHIYGLAIVLNWNIFYVFYKCIAMLKKLIHMG